MIEIKNYNKHIQDNMLSLEQKQSHLTKLLLLMEQDFLMLTFIKI